jgi:hypothetical protein
MASPDAFPTIPSEEFPQRWSRVQALMTEHGLDVLLAYGDDRVVAGPAHVRWLANVPVHIEPMCIRLLPTPGGGLRMEDGFRITAAGAERVNRTPWLIQK